MAKKKIIEDVEEIKEVKISKVKLTVIREFKDKYTMQTYKVGDVLEVDEARAKELLESKFNLVEKK